MNGRLDRKAFLTTLGATGLGLGLTASGGARSALAQEDATPPAGSGWDHGPGMLDEHFKLLAEFYTGFTAALADELDGTNADEVDAAIRKAMMTVIDSHKDDGILTHGQAEALKALVATTDVPLGPGPIGMAMFALHGGWAAGHAGPGHGMFMGGMAPCEGAMSPGYGGMAEGDMPRGMEGMPRGMEEMPPGGMQPGEGSMAGMRPGQEGNQSSYRRHRRARRDRSR